MYFNFLFTNSDNTPFPSNISGQYEIVGEIENNELVIQVPQEDFSIVYDEINKVTVLPTHYFSNNTPTTEIKLKQPPSIRFNSGWSISITANDRDSSTLSEKYLIEVKPLKKESL